FGNGAHDQCGSEWRLQHDRQSAPGRGLPQRESACGSSPCQACPAKPRACGLSVTASGNYNDVGHKNVSLSGGGMVELVGQTLGKYRIDELIGLGGMARVYKAYQDSLKRFVAIKAIPVQGEGAQELTFVHRFNDEARMVANLTHTNIVPIYDFD